MLQQQINLYSIPIETVFNKVKIHFPNVGYVFKKHVVVIENELNETVGYIRLPLHLRLDNQLNILDEEVAVLYLTLESGNAAICVQKGKSNLYHTTFSAYMTRKKQGYSQIKYLNKKGKSRAGSRVRLASTIDFFENINTKLAELMDEYKIDRIALNCTPTLIPYLYQSKVACPFDKKDERLYKIPLHIPQSNFGNLSSTIKKLMAPILVYDEQYDEEIKNLFKDYF